ncbi:MAG: hypothetical protein ACW960_02015 [Candidatus Thorarchaeota archaeon]
MRKRAILAAYLALAIMAHGFPIAAQEISYTVSQSPNDRIENLQALSLTLNQLAPPTLLSPENESLVANQWPVFSWTHDSEFANFTLQISTSIGFNDSNTYSFRGINRTSFRPSGNLSPFPETPHAIWYWRVQNVNESGEGLFSEVWWFEIVSHGPPPANPAFLIAMTVVPVAVLVLCVGGLYLMRKWQITQPL